MNLMKLELIIYIPNLSRLNLFKNRVYLNLYSKQNRKKMVSLFIYICTYFYLVYSIKKSVHKTRFSQSIVIKVVCFSQTKTNLHYLNVPNLNFERTL